MPEPMAILSTVVGPHHLVQGFRSLRDLLRSGKKLEEVRAELIALLDELESQLVTQTEDLARTRTRVEELERNVVELRALLEVQSLKARVDQLEKRRRFLGIF